MHNKSTGSIRNQSVSGNNNGMAIVIRLLYLERESKSTENVSWKFTLGAALPSKHGCT
ncbi:MAG TPA: hypothetical protein VN670_01430 [Acidobacteriaceae bacterium]|nr:hypothetical protein [Acidobacteriaceae bacterium]